MTGIVLSAVGATAPAAAQISRTALTPGTVVISNVGLVPMTSDTLIRGTTVLIRDGHIAAVARDGSIRLPSEARRIDGRGKYLIPGLADMHVHLYSDDEIPDSLAGDELGVMLANGVTAIRLMIGTPEHLELRRKIESGRMLGPQLWVASPQFIGTPDVNSKVVTTPDEATAAVKEVADAGYDFWQRASISSISTTTWSRCWRTRRQCATRYPIWACSSSRIGRAWITSMTGRWPGSPEPPREPGCGPHPR